MVMNWIFRRTATENIGAYTAESHGVRFTVATKNADQWMTHPATLTVEWFGVARKDMRTGGMAYRVAERIANAMDALTYTIGGVTFTADQVDTLVELWGDLITIDRVTGSTRGYYGSNVHLSNGVTSDWPDGNAYRMPNALEIRALVMADGEATAYPATEDNEENPWDQTDEMAPVELSLISCGDYHGSFEDAANNRHLDGLPGVSVRYPNTRDVESESIVELGSVTAFTLEEETATAESVITNLREVVGAMASLERGDVVVFHETNLHEYTMEQARSWWENGLGRDVTRQIEDMNPAGQFEDLPELEDGKDPEDAIREAYFGCPETEWKSSNPGQTATSVHNTGHEAAVKYAARTVFGWA